ncbi:MAG: TROVE domain-containing protein [Methylobacteriaceae bacterium]|nr:TROVE domain-containing protein [Methylobacteriaceae bacterium]MBV9246770.1 TROVE domain-containing protein [Methylobacteriaceae bacterium]
MPRKYTQHIASSAGQADILPGMVANSAGGAAYPVDDWKRLERFLVLGSEGGSYYAAERALTRENAVSVEACLAADAARAVDMIVAISASGRAPKNEPAIFALALAAAHPEEKVRAAALAALPKVCRIGTHLFQFAEAVNELRGWGRGLRRAVADWYLDKPVDAVALQAVKYKQREGWSHRDLLRLAHPAAPEDDGARRALFDWMCGREVAAEVLPRLARANDAALAAKSAAEVAQLVRETSLPREAVPPEWQNDREVWDALLADMPMTAMIRTLNRMTAAGLLMPMSDAARFVAGRIEDGRALATARVHPLALLIAQTTYAGGRGLRGKLSWEPVREVVDALDRAFYLAFEVVEPADKRILLALDVSGSMDAGQVAGAPLTPREGAAAMALITVATEARTHCVAFSAAGPQGWKSPFGSRYSGYTDGLTPLHLSPKQRLDDVVARTRELPFGGTDCALPMLYAIERKLAVDAFVVYTDSETWAGKVHPVEALRRYRSETGVAAKLVVVGMVANGFSIADPSDSGTLDVVGFDAAAPAVIADFLRG